MTFYGSRFYDSSLGRFIQPDSIVPQPGNPQDFNKYAYARNSPVNYVDPSGHAIACANDGGTGCEGLGPKSILDRVGDLDVQDELLRAFSRTHPNYNIYADPTIEDDTAKFIVATARFREAIDQASKSKSFDLRSVFNAFGGVAFWGSILDPDSGGGNSGEILGLVNVADARKALGLPTRGDPEDKYTVAILQADESEIWGVSAYGQKLNFSVNNISASHAEIDALNQLVEKRLFSGRSGGKAVMFTDREPCLACGRLGGIRSGVEAAKLDELRVIYPEGEMRIVPRR